MADLGIEGMKVPDEINSDEEFSNSGSEGNGYLEDDEVGKAIDLKGDGKLMKTIEVKGSGWEKPNQGAEVTVHYTGTLEDGTVFDSSRERDPFVFKLGEGQVIKGWDQGVKTMKRGERAILKCHHEYAYGVNGRPPTIPPGATLTFDVELLSWNEWKHVSGSAKDGTITKKILQPGKGYEKPDFDTECTVSWVLTAEGSDAVLEEKADVTIVIGSEALLEGLEKGLVSMKSGEQAIIKLQPLARGVGSELHPIPTGAADDDVLNYNITLSSFTAPPQAWKLKGPEKFEWSNKRKNEGNDLFKVGKLARAQKKYKAAIDYIISDYEMSEEEKAEASSLKTAITLNLAACEIKKGDWPEVEKRCNEALDIQPQNTKALLRRGKAFNEMNKWKEAKTDLQAVIATEGAPEVADAKKELNKVLKKIKAQDEKDKKVFGGMFGKIDLKKEEEPSESTTGPTEGEA